MLGKQHISITLATIFPFLIPLLFSNNSDYFLYFGSITAGVLVGSLTPDADCGGKSKLYYDFKLVYDIMQPLQKFVIYIFKKFNLKYKLNLEYEVNNEHRGIMHAPIGIFISSFVLTLIAFLITLVVAKESILIVTSIVFVGVFTGQFLHLLEDSCTVAGINWKFPFGTKELKGKIYTFEKFEGKRDIRPTVYEYSLWSITIVLFIGYAFEIINFVISMVYAFISLAIILVWILIIYLSKTEFKFWYQDIEKIKKIKQVTRNFGK
jgi:membrane-bound metal-dependent hydrolase YbcI (DUF457 family)